MGANSCMSLVKQLVNVDPSHLLHDEKHFLDELV
jgi:hypothetical protein